MLSHTQLETQTGYSKKDELNNRILKVFTLSFLSLTLYFLVSNYYTTIKDVETLTLERLQGIVRDLAERIDPEQHQLLTTAHTSYEAITKTGENEHYATIHELLRQTQLSHDLSSPIYTFVRSDVSAEHLEFIVTSNEAPYYRHRFSSSPLAGIKDMEKGGVLPHYKDEFGHWLSAFAPIRNQAGEPIAYVQADEKFDHFIYQVRMKTARNALFSLAGFGVVFFFISHYFRLILKKEVQQKELLKKTLAKSQQLSIQLEASEQKLKENAIKLEQNNKDLRDFAHIASHDLKAPIRSIHSFAQLLRRRLGKEVDDNVNDYLDFILGSASRAQKLITGLLQYSTADKDLGEQVEFPVADAVEEVRDNLASNLEERKARITYTELPTIEANPTLISQVFQNLINNGIKYNQSEYPVVEVGSGVDAEKGCYFFVKDNGIGIAPEYQRDIFKMFTRLHSSDQYEGSGIGLAFCSRVIKAYGGNLWLESGEGKGATFYFTLPNATHAVSSIPQSTA